MAISSNLGFPRIGPKRELKKALESFWAGQTGPAELLAAGRQLRRDHWRLQQEAGIQHIPSNDFSLYDHVLDTCAMVGTVPSRYGSDASSVDLNLYFAMARGIQSVTAMEMTKWFDTNYHYIVPEFVRGQKFRLGSTKPVDEFQEARELGLRTRPVLLSPVSFLLLGKAKEPGLDPIDLLDGLLPVYEEVLQRLAQAGAEWVQLDEPCLILDRRPDEPAAFGRAYGRLRSAAPDVKILLATYFEGLRDKVALAFQLPVDAVHLDLVRSPGQLDEALAAVPKRMSLSLGVVDGRNIWKNDFARSLELLEKAGARLGRERVMVAPSCSLLFTPIDLDLETKLDGEIKSWLAFSKQKLAEIVTLTRALNEGRSAVADRLEANARAAGSRRASARVHNPAVKARCAAVTPEQTRRKSPFSHRRPLQREALRLPVFPTTTTGSFPQTAEVRAARANLKAGKITQAEYDAFIESEIERAIRFQEEIGLDVLVHGEFERSDMVEYFGEQLDGFAFTQNGWVQSYGS
ncbi:MAG: 5-methyltetrahydropteroyltriglutamate--homocysteine S-methyltransferase, partial [Acidobacteria bacterium]|nr:5-methyltetrahydropteroyltriglutamate--homocysteine S-methyltransferase [Acidobacteriota bacterium]